MACGCLGALIMGSHIKDFNGVRSANGLRRQTGTRCLFAVVDCTGILKIAPVFGVMEKIWIFVQLKIL